MKLSIFLLLGSAIFILGGCKKNQINPIDQVSSIAKGVSDSSLTTVGITDSSRRVASSSNQRIMADNLSSTRVLISDAKVGICDSIEIKIWGDYVYGEHNTLSVSVDPDYVLVGGGARVTNTDNTDVGVNAILVSAYPVDDGTFTTYTGVSKDHQQVYYHRLWVYAIGMRVYSCFPKNPGWMDAEYLLPFLNLSSVTSSPAVSHPIATLNAPTGYYALSGGAKINYPVGGQGNLLVADGQGISGNGDGTYTLFSSGKDQNEPCPATITSYCLSLQKDAHPQFFKGFTVYSFANSVGVTNHLQSISFTTNFSNLGTILAGIGGYASYTGWGRLLYAMYPVNSTTAIVSSKDQINSDISGSVSIQLSGIKTQY